MEQFAYKRGRKPLPRARIRVGRYHSPLGVTLRKESCVWVEFGSSATLAWSPTHVPRWCSAQMAQADAGDMSET